MAAPDARSGPEVGRRPLARLTLLLAGLGFACAGRDSGLAVASPANARRILLVGIDAGDWLAIDPLVAAGKLPALARLRAHGRTGVMLSTPPLLSPILWTTIATGRTPEDHGVLDFMADLPGGGQAPVTSGARQVPALWNLFSNSSRRVAIVAWWATWPAESVNGTIVSDRVAPQLPRGAALVEGSITPREQAERLAPAIVRPDTLRLDDLRVYGPMSELEFRRAQSAPGSKSSSLYANHDAHLATVVAATRTYGKMAEAILAQGQPDLLAVYLEGVDTVSHLFVRDPRRGPPAIEAAYRDADGLLARLAAASDPDTWVVVCSDHGFYGADAGVAGDPADLAGPASAWHRPYGIVGAIAAGDLASASARPSTPQTVGTVTPLDIAPTLLHVAGLPVGDRMPGRVVTALLPADVATRPVLKASIPDVGPSPPANTTNAADPDAIARLQALGYVGTNPTSLARRNLGEILYRRGNLTAAEKELRAALEAQPKNVAALLWFAKTLRDQGRPREALRAYGRAAALPEGRDEALVQAADLAASAGLLDEGRRMVAAARSHQADTASDRLAAGILARGGGDVDVAEREFRAALALTPNSFDALSRLLDILIATRQVEGGLPLFQSAVASAPASPRLLALWGEALLAVGDAAKAEAPLARALNLAPDSAALRLDLARSLLAQHKAEAVDSVLVAAPPSRERNLLKGAAAAARGHWAEAASEYESVLRDGAPTPEVLNALAWAKIQLGHPNEAAVILERSLSLDGKQPEIRRLLSETVAKNPKEPH